MSLSNYLRVPEPDTSLDIKKHNYDKAILTLTPDRIRVIELDATKALSFRGDFKGLIIDSGGSLELLHLHLGLNKLTSSQAYTGKEKRIYIANVIDDSDF